MSIKVLELTDEQVRDVDFLVKRGGQHSVTTGMLDQLERDRAARHGKLTRGQKYERFMEALNEIRNDPAYRDEWIKAGLPLIAKDIQPADVFSSPTLSSVSIQYANDEYIGEALMPVAPVSKSTGNVPTYGQRDRVVYPDDAMANRGQATEIVETRTMTAYSLVPYGYSNFVASQTLRDQDSPLDEMVDLVESIAEGLAFRRELRIATILNATGNFGANTNAIAAADRWNTATGGNPISDVQTADAALWSGKGPGFKAAYSSLDVYNVLSRHPDILALFQYKGGTPGLATPDMIAEFFGFKKYLVGRARQDTANEGAASATFTRIWGDRFGIVRVAQRPSLRNAVFGYTLRQGAPLTVTEFERRMGHGGGWVAQVSVMEQSRILAATTGYLIDTPI
jgi:hypothetical protein